MPPRSHRGRRAEASTEPTPDRERLDTGSDPNAQLEGGKGEELAEELDEQEDDDERPTPPLPTPLPRRTATEMLEELQDVAIEDLSNKQLRDHLERTKLLQELVDTTTAKRKRTESTTSRTLAGIVADPKRVKDPIEHLITKGKLPQLRAHTQAAFNEWLTACERVFYLFDCDSIDTQKRTVFAMSSVQTDNKQLKDAVSALNRRLGRDDLGDLYWAEMRQIIQDTLTSPAVRRAQLAIQYHSAAMKESQAVASFHKYIAELESQLDYEIPESQAKVDDYFARLPGYIRSKIIENNVLTRSITTDELLAEAQRYEQTYRASKEEPGSRTPSSSSSRGDSRGPRDTRNGRGNHRGRRGGRGEAQSLPTRSYAERAETSYTAHADPSRQDRRLYTGANAVMQRQSSATSEKGKP